MLDMLMMRRRAMMACAGLLEIMGRFARRVTAAGSSAIRDGRAKIMQLYGNTVVWNSLVNPYNGDLATYDDATVSMTSGGLVTLNVLRAVTSTHYVSLPTHSVVTGYSVVGHKYYIEIIKVSGTPVDLGFYNDGGGIAAGTIASEGFATIGTATAANRFYLRIGPNETAAATYTFYIRLHDLTQMFGAGNEASALGVANLDTAANRASAVAEFKRRFPAEHYAYDTGSLLSFVSNPAVGEDEGTRLVSYDGSDVEIGSCKLPVASGNQPLVLRSAGTVRDEVRSNRVIRRVGTRSYRDGDENDATLVTDKTDTFYELATPTEETIPSWDNSYLAERGGTEALLPANTASAASTELIANIGYKH